MPRINRKYYISSFLHVMVQGINKEDIFKNDYYKKVYLNLIIKNFKEYNLKILSYVIMNNHAHMLISYDKIEELSKFMHLINTKYAKFYNKNENRVGYVFRDRYKCEQIKDEKHLFNVLPYIHYNPVKAKIVNCTEKYKFSSYNDYINGNIDKENAYILFNTYNYIEKFNEIHKNYSESKEMKEDKIDNYEEVIKNFKKMYKITTTEIIKKEKNLLLELILEMQERTSLKDYEIAKILGIGKNRITLLKIKNKGKEARPLIPIC